MNITLDIHIFRRIFVWIIVMIFSLTIIPAEWVRAQSTVLPQPGTLVNLSYSYQPIVLKGLEIDPANPFQFEFIVSPGDEFLEQQDLREHAYQLVKYFFAALTIPEQDLWVNLSPNEPDRIIPNAFGQTEMGRDLLAQDYLLKQIGSSLLHPDGEIGKQFWQHIYAKAYEQYGQIDIPANTLHKVWIVPENVRLFEHDQKVLINNSRLKVMLEEDYLQRTVTSDQRTENDSPQDIGHSLPAGQAGSQVTDLMREIMIPVIEQEVNEGKHFAPLRQIYHSLILAIWFKHKFHQALINQVYTDAHKTQGLHIQDTMDKDKIFAQYVDSFQQGAFSLIKEEYDPVLDETIPRKYFSGGAGFDTTYDAFIFDNASNHDDTHDYAMTVMAEAKHLSPEKAAKITPEMVAAEREALEALFDQMRVIYAEEAPWIRRIREEILGGMVAAKNEVRERIEPIVLAIQRQGKPLFTKAQAKAVAIRINIENPEPALLELSTYALIHNGQEFPIKGNHMVKLLNSARQMSEVVHVFDHWGEYGSTLVPNLLLRKDLSQSEVVEILALLERNGVDQPTVAHQILSEQLSLEELQKKLGQNSLKLAAIERTGITSGSVLNSAHRHAGEDIDTRVASLQQAGLSDVNVATQVYLFHREVGAHLNFEQDIVPMVRYFCTQTGLTGRPLHAVIRSVIKRGLHYVKLFDEENQTGLINQMHAVGLTSHTSIFNVLKSSTDASYIRGRIARLKQLQDKHIGFQLEEQYLLADIILNSKSFSSNFKNVHSYESLSQALHALLEHRAQAPSLISPLTDEQSVYVKFRSGFLNNFSLPALLDLIDFILERDEAHKLKSFIQHEVALDQQSLAELEQDLKLPKLVRRRYRGGVVDIEYKYAEEWKWDYYHEMSYLKVSWDDSIRQDAAKILFHGHMSLALNGPGYTLDPLGSLYVAAVAYRPYYYLLKGRPWSGKSFINFANWHIWKGSAIEEHMGKLDQNEKPVYFVIHNIRRKYYDEHKRFPDNDWVRKEAMQRGHAPEAVDSLLKGMIHLDAQTEGDGKGRSEDLHGRIVGAKPKQTDSFLRRSIAAHQNHVLTIDGKDLTAFDFLSALSDDDREMLADHFQDRDNVDVLAGRYGRTTEDVKQSIDRFQEGLRTLAEQDRAMTVMANSQNIGNTPPPQITAKIVEQERKEFQSILEQMRVVYRQEAPRIIAISGQRGNPKGTMVAARNEVRAKIEPLLLAAKRRGKPVFTKAQAKSIARRIPIEDSEKKLVDLEMYYLVHNGNDFIIKGSDLDVLLKTARESEDVVGILNRWGEYGSAVIRHLLLRAALSIDEIKSILRELEVNGIEHSFVAYQILSEHLPLEKLKAKLQQEAPRFAAIERTGITHESILTLAYRHAGVDIDKRVSSLQQAGLSDANVATQVYLFYGEVQSSLDFERDVVPMVRYFCTQTELSGRTLHTAIRSVINRGVPYRDLFDEENQSSLINQMHAIGLTDDYPMLDVLLSKADLAHIRMRMSRLQELQTQYPEFKVKSQYWLVDAIIYPAVSSKEFQRIHQYENQAEALRDILKYQSRLPFLTASLDEDRHRYVRFRTRFLKDFRLAALLALVDFFLEEGEALELKAFIQREAALDRQALASLDRDLRLPEIIEKRHRGMRVVIEYQDAERWSWDDHHELAHLVSSWDESVRQDAAKILVHGNMSLALETPDHMPDPLGALHTASLTHSPYRLLLKNRSWSTRSFAHHANWYIWQGSLFEEQMNQLDPGERPVQRAIYNARREHFEQHERVPDDEWVKAEVIRRGHSPETVGNLLEGGSLEIEASAKPGKKKVAASHGRAPVAKPKQADVFLRRAIAAHQNHALVADGKDLRALDFLGALPFDEQEMLIDHFQDGDPVDALADRYGRTVKDVRQSISRFRSGLKVLATQDPAMEVDEAVGGIDLNPEQLDVYAQTLSGVMCTEEPDHEDCVSFDFSPEQVEHMRSNIIGFTPVIINFQPLNP